MTHQTPKSAAVRWVKANPGKDAFIRIDYLADRTYKPRQSFKSFGVIQGKLTKDYPESWKPRFYVYIDLTGDVPKIQEKDNSVPKGNCSPRQKT